MIPRHLVISRDFLVTLAKNNTGRLERILRHRPRQVTNRTGAGLQKIASDANTRWRQCQQLFALVFKAQRPGQIPLLFKRIQQPRRPRWMNSQQFTQGLHTTWRVYVELTQAMEFVNGQARGCGKRLLQLMTSEEKPDDVKARLCISRFHNGMAEEGANVIK